MRIEPIHRYEHGSNRVSFSRLVEIAHALDCRVVELIGDLDDENMAQPRFRDDGAHIRIKGGAELLAAFAAAPRPLQQAIRKLVQALADDQRGRAPESGEGERVSPGS